MEMERVELTLASLADLDDGKVVLMFGAELKRCLQDCLNRPTDGKARKVSLVCSVKPVADDDGDCRGVRMGFDVKSALPPRTTIEYPLDVTKAGQAVFNREAESDVTDPIDD